MSYFHLPAALLVAAATACSSADPGGRAEPSAAVQQAAPATATTMVYECNDMNFTARFGPGEMAIWLEDRYLVLPQVVSGSGAKYEEADVMVWTKGDTAQLVVAGSNYSPCALAPRLAPWEDARRRGVDFRAVGNEPGWHLEIQHEKHLLFVGDYGMLRVATPYPGVQVEASHRSYHAQTAAHDLLVEISDQHCIDSMSGDAYPSQVRVQLDGTEYRGCGQALDHPWE